MEILDYEYYARWKNNTQKLRTKKNKDAHNRVTRIHKLTSHRKNGFKEGTLIGNHVVWDCGYIEHYNPKITKVI